MADHIPQLRTPGVIADEVGFPLARVLYVLKKYNVRPIGRAGILRLYDCRAVDVVRNALREMDQRQEAAP
jgi:hypothetical protein